LTFEGDPSEHQTWHHAGCTLRLMCCEILGGGPGSSLAFDLTAEPIVLMSSRVGHADLAAWLPLLSLLGLDSVSPVAVLATLLTYILQPGPEDWAGFDLSAPTSSQSPDQSDTFFFDEYILEGADRPAGSIVYAALALLRPGDPQTSLSKWAASGLAFPDTVVAEARSADLRLRTRLRRRCCAHCGLDVPVSAPSFKRCASCGPGLELDGWSYSGSYYCSPECHQNGWESHRGYCKIGHASRLRRRSCDGCGKRKESKYNTRLGMLCDVRSRCPTKLGENARPRLCRDRFGSRLDNTKSFSFSSTRVEVIT
jgi:hypothetical protein